MSERDDIIEQLEVWCSLGNKSSTMIRELSAGCQALTEEKERLQGYVSDWRLQVVDLENERDLLVLDFKRLTAENERLRAALHGLVDNMEPNPDDPAMRYQLNSNFKVRWPDLMAAAQSALTRKPEGQDNG